MTRKSKTSAPQPIADAELDQASGGILIGLLLPAVQKVREAAATPQLDANARLGDGSVKTL